MSQELVLGNLEKELKIFGLSEYEAMAYIALLKLGTANINEIALKSKVPRTRLYDVLLTLETKGWVKHFETRPLVYYPMDPSVVMNNEWEKIKTKRKLIVKALNDIYRGKEAQFVQIEGRNMIETALKEIMILTEKYLFVDIGLILYFGFSIFDDQFVEIVNSNIPLYILVSPEIMAEGKDMVDRARTYTNKIVIWEGNLKLIFNEISFGIFLEGNEYSVLHIYRDKLMCRFLYESFLTKSKIADIF